MAHFLLIVLGENIEEQLEKYNKETENSNYLVFIEEENKLRNKYENEKENYSTFEEYVKVVHGYEQRDIYKNTYGYWGNPNGKWSYYNIGGRWSNFFKLKEGSKPIKYNKNLDSFFAEKVKEGFANSARAKDIDFNFMREFINQNSIITYNKLEEVLNGRELPSLNHYIELHNGDSGKAYLEYKSLPVVKDLLRAGFFASQGHLEEFGINREFYLEKKFAEMMAPFSLVKDGKWFERGESVWWSDELVNFTDEDWNKKFLELINSIDPETILTIIDYHS